MIFDESYSEQPVEDRFKGKRGKRGPKIFPFGYKELSEYTGLTIKQLYRAQYNGEFDCNDFGSVVDFCHKIKYKEL